MTDAAQPLNPFTVPINAEAQRLAAQPSKPVVRSEGTTPTPPTNQADMSPQDRWLAHQAAADRADPWRDPNIVLTRDPKTGELVAREKKIGADGEATAGKPLNQTNADGEAAVPGETTEGQLYKFGDLELTGSQIRDLTAFKAETDLRKAQVPVSAAEYKMVLPADLKLPDGVNFTIAENDPTRAPALQALREWSFKNQLSQGQVSDLLGLYASAQSREMVMISNAARAEREKLGVSGTARVDAISMFLRGRYGDSAAKAMINTLVTEGQVRIWEDVITRFTNGGGGSFSQRGRETETQTISDAAYDKMTYTEKKDYAERMSARAAQNGR